MTSVLERGLPANAHAERLVLGSILLNGERYPDIAAVLAPGDFALEKHRRIFARMKDLYERGENIDRVTVADELNKHGQLESVDGLTYLLSLDDGLPEIANLDSYVRIVTDKSLLRQTMFACEKVIQQCALATEPSMEILEAGAALLEKIRGQTDRSGNQWVTPEDVLCGRVDSVLFPARGAGGIETPWPRLTEMTSGWSPCDLIIVAGRPGMGKSVIGMQQAHTSARKGTGVAYFSLEMSKESLVRRLVAGISRVDAHRARSGFLTMDERQRMLEAAADLDGLPLFIDDSRAHTPAAITTALRRLKAKHPVGVIIIDHLQLMKTTGRAESRHQELSEICHGFKRLAGQMGCVVMLLSQLNRACEQERRLPVLSDLKESGSIEEDADVVVFVHRPEMYRRDDPSLHGQAELIVAKQRNGPTGKLSMRFLSAFQVFEASALVEDPQ
ncbi:MAG TPA: replicative DNA helicase [Bryobacteraceae bacterium]